MSCSFIVPPSSPVFSERQLERIQDRDKHFDLFSTVIDEVRFRGRSSVLPRLQTSLSRCHGHQLLCCLRVRRNDQPADEVTAWLAERVLAAVDDDDDPFAEDRNADGDQALMPWLRAAMKQGGAFGGLYRVSAQF